MKDWLNPDLLVPPERRQQLEAEFPGMLAVFDWPTLRERFGRLNRKAIESRANRRRRGTIAVSVAALGASLAPLLPLVDLLGGTFAEWTAGVSAVLSIVGLAWAVGLKVVDRHKASWLEHRLQTERLRQFYFQVMLSDPTLAVRALTDADAARQWQTARERAMTMFDGWLKSPVEPEFRAVIDDVNQDLAWQSAAWRAPPPAPPAGPATDAYFEILRQQRIEVQRRYVREKLAPRPASPETQLRLATTTGWVLTVAAVLVSAVLAAALFAGVGTDSAAFNGLCCVIALIGIVSIYLRVLAEGLGLKSDVDRYAWYRRAVEKIAGDFTDPAPAARLAALRCLEIVAYREMREFLLTHDRSSFIFS